MAQTKIKKKQLDMTELLNFFYPVGTIYETTSTNLDTTTKMGTYFGGTWEAYGSGRVLVAKSADTEFDTIGETGGAKTHTLSEAEMPTHSHTTVQRFNTNTAGGYVAWFNGAATGAWSNATDSKGSSAAHNNLQPYIVVYRYRRTA